MTTSAPASRLRFGANYTPSSNWMHWWLDPEWNSVQRDFDALADLGVDHLRIFPMWPYIQPNRSLIRPAALEQLRQMAQLAGQRGLDVSVDAIQGHMSSFDYLPAWLTTWHSRNMFTDPDAIGGQRDLVAALASTLNELPNFLGLCVGNEVNQFSGPPHPFPQPCTPQQAEAWLTTLLSAADEAAPGRMNLHAEYDAAWYLDDHPFMPAHAARLGAMTTIHSWIFNGTGQAYGPLSTQSIRHAEYMLELSKAFATTAGRRTWLQEIGAPLNCMSAAQAPEFAEQALRHAARSANLWGVTWWCSHDVSHELADFPELEYSLGLLDAASRPKPLGLRVAHTMRELRDFAPARRPVAVAIDVDSTGVPISRASLGPRGAVFEAWMDLAASGCDPALVVTGPQGMDTALLAERGIDDIIGVPAAQMSTIEAEPV